ncbi:Lrp/AsnC family transcriptional regulator [Beduini massiliensis]|uniref:Lrp/AsnC family transcriptional regulator n=1 Tax=Beduini massiliensis TaxID=1585974 RepID=UPI00059AA199|nr:Lrp/AsnC family transcriptional regulator [Beduini massiliensis]
MKELALLSLLEKNARMEVKDLAMALQESEENVLNTMSDLEKRKVICGYHTMINYDHLNKDDVMALIQINATPEREYGYDRVAANIYKFPEVDTMYLLSGAYEFLVIIKGKTMQDVANFVASKLAIIESVTGTSTYFVLKQYKNNGVAFVADEDPNDRLVVTP